MQRNNYNTLAFSEEPSVLDMTDTSSPFSRRGDQGTEEGQAMLLVEVGAALYTPAAHSTAAPEAGHCWGEGGKLFS